MTTYQVYVKSLQCGNSFKNIENALLKTEGVAAIEFFTKENKVCITTEALSNTEIVASLAALGYYDTQVKSFFSKKNTFDHWYCHCCSGCDKPE